MDKFFYPPHPARVIFTGPSECGNSFFLTILILNIFNEYDKLYIHSPSLHQDFYQKLKKHFIKLIPININPNNLNEKDLDLVIDQICNDKGLKKSDAEIEIYESKEESKFPQE